MSEFVVRATPMHTRWPMVRRHRQPGSAVNQKIPRALRSLLEPGERLLACAGCRALRSQTDAFAYNPGGPVSETDAIYYRHFAGSPQTDAFAYIPGGPVGETDAFYYKHSADSPEQDAFAYPHHDRTPQTDAFMSSVSLPLSEHLMALTDRRVIDVGSEGSYAIPLELLVDAEVKNDCVVFRACAGCVYSPPLMQAEQMAALARQEIRRTHLEAAWD